MPFEDTTTIEKQRRNVLIVTSVILFIIVGNVDIGQTAQISLLNAQINNPHAIYAFLYTFLVYFAWRYFVSFRSIRAWDDYYQSVRQKMTNLAFDKAHTILIKDGIKKEDISSHNRSGNNWPEPINKAYNDITKNGAIYYFQYQVQQSKNTRTSKKLETAIRIEGAELNKIKRYTFVRHFFLTHLFLEYYLPHLMILLTLALSVTHYYEHIAQHIK